MSQRCQGGSSGPRLLALLALLATLAGCVPGLEPSVDAAPADGGVADAASSNDAAVVDAGPGADAALLPDAASASHEIDAILALLEATPGDEPAIDAALGAAAWRSGWPLSDGRRWLFAVRFDDRPSGLSLVGDLNGWDPLRWPAEVSATGRHFWVLIDVADFDVPAAGSKYKWHTASGEFRSPPEAVAYGRDGFGEFGWVRPPADEAYFERFLAAESAFLSDARAYRAHLPAGFAPHTSTAARMRTLLLHDGQNVFDPDAFFGGWRVDEALASTPDVVALAIDNAPDRMFAYTHVDDVIDGTPLGGGADAYGRLVFEEALPFFRARYGIVADGRSLMIAGSSLGGLVTLDLAMERDGAFGCAAGLSSTLGWGSFDGAADSSRVLARRWATTVAHGSIGIYLDSGGDVAGACDDRDGDGVDDDADDSDNYCVTLQLRDTLRALGYRDGVDLTYAWAPGAMHNEAAWATRFPGALAACSAMGWTAP